MWDGDFTSFIYDMVVTHHLILLNLNSEHKEEHLRRQLCTALPKLTSMTNSKSDVVNVNTA